MKLYETIKGKIKAAAAKVKKVKPIATLSLGAVAATVALPSCQTPTRYNSWQTTTMRGPSGEIIQTHNSQQWNLQDVSRASRDFGRASRDFASSYETIRRANFRY